MTQFIDGEGDQEEVFEHESYGMIRVHRLHGGGKNLFGVDYDTGNSVRLEIKRGELRRNAYREWFFEREIVASIEMSEVQYARMISSPNTTGVPCTLRYACTEGFKKMEDPPSTTPGPERMQDDIKKAARRVSANMDHIRKLADEMAEGKAPTKAQLKDLAMWVQQTQQAIASDLPYLTQRQEEKVDEMVHSSKAEIEAHVQQQLIALGKEALGEKIKKGGGVTIRLAGKPVDMLPPPDKKVIE
jgi:hypothetical protein